MDDLGRPQRRYPEIFMSIMLLEVCKEWGSRRGILGGHLNFLIRAMEDRVILDVIDDVFRFSERISIGLIFTDWLTHSHTHWLTHSLTHWGRKIHYSDSDFLFLLITDIKWLFSNLALISLITVITLIISITFIPNFTSVSGNSDSEDLYTLWSCFLLKQIESSH